MRVKVPHKLLNLVSTKQNLLRLFHLVVFNAGFVFSACRSIIIPRCHHCTNSSVCCNTQTPIMKYDMKSMCELTSIGVYK